jgi:hypothetical protein
MSLTQIAQTDFSAGMLRGTAPDVQPGVGLASSLNGLFNDDGDVYRRGGDVHAGASVGAEILWLWTGYLSGQPVELVATYTAVYANGALLAGTLPIEGPMQIAAFEDAVYLPNGTVIRSTGGVLSATTWARPGNIDPDAPMHVANVVGRLVVGCLNRVAFSDPKTREVFAALDYHALGGGVIVNGLFAITDTLLIFTNFGLWVVTNMAFDLTDAAGNVQQSLSLLVPGLSLVHEAGLAPYQNRVVAPCIDRIYLVDAVNPPTPISDSIAVDWRGYVAQGMLPGGAKVFDSTLFMPVRLPPLVVPEGWTPGAIVTLLVCRLSRPVQGRLTYFPWSQFGGHPATLRSFDVSLTGATPRLLGGGQDGAVTDVTGVLTPSPDNTLDADGIAPDFFLETRDFPTGQGQPNHLRRIRLRYTALGAGQITAAYSSDPGHEDWVQLDPQPLADGKEPLSWWLPTAVRVRFVRVSFETQDPVQGLVVHQIELNTRSAAHAR